MLHFDFPEHQMVCSCINKAHWYAIGFRHLRFCVTGDVAAAALLRYFKAQLKWQKLAADGDDINNKRFSKISYRCAMCAFCKKRHAANKPESQ